MPDELLVLTDDLRKQIRKAGTNKLDNAQLAMTLSITDHELRSLMMKYPDLMYEYKAGETEWSLKCLDAIKEIATNPDHKQQFVAAKYLYELYSNRQSGANVTINMQQPKDDNQKFLEIVDAETVERIRND